MVFKSASKVMFKSGSKVVFKSAVNLMFKSALKFIFQSEQESQGEHEKRRTTTTKIKFKR